MAVPIEIRVLRPSEHVLYWALYKEAVSTEPRIFAHARSDMADLPIELADQGERHTFVVGGFDGTELIGFVRVDRRMLRKLSHKVEVRSVFLLPQYRGRGLAKAILGHAMQVVGGKVEFLRLYVNVDNDVAIHLYESLNFRIYAREACAKKLDGCYIDEFIMECDIRHRREMPENAKNVM